MRLLLVEDESDIATALARGLRLQGYAVDVTGDGQQALELATITDYDLLMLDLNLPTMDGLEVCRQLRASHSALPILMLTARSQPQERVIGLDTGADDYLIKPFYFAELLARVRALLRRDIRVRTLLLEYKDITLDASTRTAWQGEAPSGTDQ